MIDLLVATHTGAPTVESSDPLFSALSQRGLQLSSRLWNDPAVDWTEGKACWLDRIFPLPPTSSPAEANPAESLHAMAAQRPTLNPLECLLWNLDRSYLRRLDEQAVPTLPTLWLEGGGPVDLAYQLDMVGWRRAYALPVQRARSGSLIADLGNEADAERGQAELAALVAEGSVILQPCLPHLAREGMRSVVFLGGELLYAVRREVGHHGAAGLEPRAVVEATELTQEDTEVARATLAAVPGEPFWTRVDLVRDQEGEVCVAGVELIESDLGLQYGGDAVERFATAIQAKLG